MPTETDGLVASVDTKLKGKDLKPDGRDDQDTDEGTDYGRLADTYGNEFELPTFTIKEIRDAIPKHCYERSGARFLSYVARDIVTLAATFLLAYKFITPDFVPSILVRGILWAAYGFSESNLCSIAIAWLIGG